MEKKKLLIFLSILLFVVFVLSLTALIVDTWLANTIDVIGIRIAMLVVSYASFFASAVFSFMVYYHNKTVSRINDDQNKRAELFRDLQFASSNYTIIEFTDRMLITKESNRYIHKYFEKDTPSYHMIHSEIDDSKEPLFYTIRIPFSVIDGKLAGQLAVSKVLFEKGNDRFIFTPMKHESITRTYTLHNEKTKRNNLIINLVFNKDSHYFDESELNLYTKIRVYIKVTSIMGVSTEGVSELFFTNPTQIEGDGLHTYKINSSNFKLTKKPYIDKDEMTTTY